jgi:DNA recombination protein RmuC
MLRPDVIVLLPDDKHIIIDAKVSLTAYEKWVNESDLALREQWTKEHLVSLKNHIASLSNKDYPALTGLQAPDFTLLFIPIESSFSMAIQADQDLFGYAWDRRIVLVSPSTLLATLKTVASIWKQDRQNKNALRIAEEGGRLYDKFVDFVKEMDTLGERLRQAQNSFDTSMNRLATGKGNLITRAEQLKALGAKTSKTLGTQAASDPEISPN